MNTKKLLTAFVFLLTAMLSASSQTVPLGPRFVLPYQTVIDGTGVPIPGALLYFYSSGTSTPLATYSDALLTTPNANPVQANAAGVFPNIFLNGNYKVILTDSSLAQIWAADPVDSAIPGGGGSFVSLPSISALSANTIPYSNVNLQGYYTAGDGGGGILVESASCSPDGVITYNDGAGHCYTRTVQSPINILWAGAKPDAGVSNTDNSTALAAAFAASQARNAAPVYAPAGNYCVKAHVLIPELIFRGAYFGTAFWACGVDSQMFSITGGGGIQVTDMTINCKGAPSDYSDVTFGSANTCFYVNTANCNKCVFERLQIQGGNLPFYVNGNRADLRMNWVFMSASYGAAIMETTGAVWADRVAVDQGTPCAGSPNYGTSISAWAATTSYATNAMAKLTTAIGQFYICATAGGTSGGTAPTATNYGTTFSDGSVTWAVVSKVGAASLLIASGAREVYVKDIDISSALDFGIEITGATPPTYIHILHPNIGQQFQQGIYALAGQYLWITDPNVSAGGLVSNTEAIGFRGFTGNVTIEGGNVFGPSYGIFIDSGTIYSVTGTNLNNASQNVTINNATVVNVTGTAIGGSNIGGSTIGVEIAGTDYINVIGNNCGGNCGGGATSGSVVHGTNSGNL